MSSWWERYIGERFRAQKNLCQLLRYQGIETARPFDPENLEEFRVAWGERIDENSRQGVLERDTLGIPPIGLPGGHVLVIKYLMADVTKSKIPKSTVRAQLLSFLQETTGMDAEQAFSRIELIPKLECILISYIPLEGSAKNEILEFNRILEYPIRHFTVAELSFDPTLHRAGPKSMTVLSPAEVEELIAQQRGLLHNGIDPLLPNYEEKLASLTDQFERQRYIEECNEEILRKLPTTNTNDPWVKWRGFKVGDVLKVVRRNGATKVSYRRVIFVEPFDNKAVKIRTHADDK